MLMVDDQGNEIVSGQQRGSVGMAHEK
jgi:hypothetical protein